MHATLKDGVVRARLMGTSVSQGSPRTASWSAVAAGYRDSSIPIRRVVTEIWRAAQSEADANWRSLISSPIVAACLEIAVESANPGTALTSAAREIARTRQSSLAAELAKRAIVQSFAAIDRAQQAFAESMFVETTDYLVARDLPEYVGESGRNQTVGEAIEFKNRVRETVAEVVRSGDSPVPQTSRTWEPFADQNVGLSCRTSTMKAIVSDHPTTGLDYLSLVPDHNLVTGIPELRKSQGALSTLEEDLLTLAAAVFAIDLASLRGERDNFGEI